MSAGAADRAASFKPAATPARSVIDVVHGVTLTDPCCWLENARASDVEACSRRQQETTLRYFDAAVQPAPGLHEELVSYIDRDATQSPFFKKHCEFFIADQFAREG